jgi:hypothetical protein
LKAAGAVLAALLAAAAGLGLATALFQGGGDGEPRQLRAAIVDQLELTAPNPAFAEEARRLLEANGYTVDYFGGEEITVDFYRALPGGGYALLILRTHSTAEITRGQEGVSSISLFTNQPYSEELYYEEQLAGRVGFAQYEEGGPKFFGVTSDFIRHSMKGSFKDTVVLMMGCDGLVNDRAADAFAGKGARAFIGWDGLVSAQHTDEATQFLLRYIVAERTEPAKAVELTMAAVGPDPDYGSRLAARP